MDVAIIKAVKKYKVLREKKKKVAFTKRKKSKEVEKEKHDSVKRRLKLTYNNINVSIEMIQSRS